jgi:hypothetical protein
VSVVSITDEMTARRLGPYGLLAVKVLEQRRVDQELEREFAVRRRRRDELQPASVTDGPTPEWVRRIRDRDADKPTRPESSDIAPDVDFRPDREAHFGHFDLILGSEAREAIRLELGAASQLEVETGGFLFAHQRRLFFADICKASGPAPNSRHGRTSVMVVRFATFAPSSASSHSEPV